MSSHGEARACSNTASESPFSRLFRREDPLYDSLAVSLLAGSQGPMMAPSTGNKPPLPAGFTFLGQFIDHDLTEFRAVEGMRQLPMNPVIGMRQSVAPEPDITAANGRTGRLDLDSVYGLQGEADTDLFDDQGYFLLGQDTRTVGNTQAPRDIQRFTRVKDGRVIADPRNDENKIIVQLHTLFMRLHNAIHATKTGGRYSIGTPEFEGTCKSVKAIYHRIVIEDYLPRLVGKSELKAVVQRLKEGTAFYNDMDRRVRAAALCKPTQAPMPVEFAHAVFRLGHSQLRDGYELKAGASFKLFQRGGGDLRGRQPITAASEIDWRLFFGALQTDGGSAQGGNALDTSLPESIFRLPPPAVDGPPVSLAERNIRRGADFGVASGQTAAVALKMKYPHIADPLTPTELALGDEILTIDPSLASQTPLWFYILREAEVREGATTHLGQVGGLIVAETILGSLVTQDVDILAAGESEPEDNVPKTAPAFAEIRSMTGLLKALGEV